MVYTLWFLWMPYFKEEITALIPPWIHKQRALFVINVQLINFHMVEWHATNRVLRQFGCIQPIPNPPQDFKEIHWIEKRVRTP